MSKALKDTKGKLNIIEVPLSAEQAMMRGFNNGKEKYAYMDWLNGHSAKDLLSAIIRHAKKMMWENEHDPDSGLNHMDHILTNAAMYVEQERRGTLKKDLLTQIPFVKSDFKIVNCVDEKTGIVETITFSSPGDAKIELPKGIEINPELLSKRQDTEGRTESGPTPVGGGLGHRFCACCRSPNSRWEDRVNCDCSEVCGPSETELDRSGTDESPSGPNGRLDWTFYT